MKIETKFDIFDYVHFIDKGQIFYGRISSIIFDESGSENKIFVYRITCCNGYTAYLTEKDLFATNEEAEQKLKEKENAKN